ncbi:hypothetical protein Glove_384g53 [Diversispora epigaea]|uniref:Zn(2)-C6 fungal-type domain-containing protein n=1 Tax=Diversispora epigaea TaxID=1348612 RepID=A0A397H3U5_9GLOM|nr:hypothetical protein Glove_384g53 [Diversispora epigaea]
MNKTNRTHVTVACRNCQKAKKKCSDNNQNPSCERCVKKGLECEYIQPVLKRGPHKIHVNELNEDENKIDPFYNNISRDDDISDLSDLHPDGFKDREIFLNMLNELEDDNNKINPLYDNISRDDDISDLSRKYGLHPNAVKDLIETYPN